MGLSTVHQILHYNKPAVDSCRTYLADLADNPDPNNDSKKRIIEGAIANMQSGAFFDAKSLTDRYPNPNDAAAVLTEAANYMKDDIRQIAESL